jgi:hypothetical protein
MSSLVARNTCDTCAPQYPYAPSLHRVLPHGAFVELRKELQLMLSTTDVVVLGSFAATDEMRELVRKNGVLWEDVHH